MCGNRIKKQRGEGVVVVVEKKTLEILLYTEAPNFHFHALKFWFQS